MNTASSEQASARLIGDVMLRHRAAQIDTIHRVDMRGFSFGLEWLPSRLSIILGCIRYNHAGFGACANNADGQPIQGIGIAMVIRCSRWRPRTDPLLVSSATPRA